MPQEALDVLQILKKAEFLTSAAQLNQCPPDVGIEVAFVGRSNSGKSTALNKITEQNRLAKTSKTPGRTQLLNFFQIDQDTRLVDLPGYGYAKVSREVQNHITHLMSDYLSERQSLKGLVLLMDIRHPLTKFDHALLDYASEYKRSVHILLTKADKLSRGAANNTLMKVRNEISNLGGDISIQTFSALKCFGIEEARDKLASWYEWI